HVRRQRVERGLARDRHDREPVVDGDPQRLEVMHAADITPPSGSRKPRHHPSRVNSHPAKSAYARARMSGGKSAGAREVVVLIGCAAVIQGALVYVSLWLPRFTRALQTISTGAVISLVVWAVVEARKEELAKDVLAIASRRLRTPAIVGGMVLAVAFFVHP